MHVTMAIQGKHLGCWFLSVNIENTWIIHWCSYFLKKLQMIICTLNVIHRCLQRLMERQVANGKTYKGQLRKHCSPMLLVTTNTKCLYLYVLCQTVLSIQIKAKSWLLVIQKFMLLIHTKVTFCSQFCKCMNRILKISNSKYWTYSVVLCKFRHLLWACLSQLSNWKLMVVDN